MAASRQVLPSAGALRQVPRPRELLRALWESPIPAVLQDARFRLVDVNDAFASLLGLPRGRLVGRDPLELQPPEDRAGGLAERETLAAAATAGTAVPPLRRRFVDAAGQPRWFSLAVTNLAERGTPPLWLSVLQDGSAEVAAREQARRAQDELAQWFELSGSGMLVYDASGLIVRCNTAFESLIDHVPVTLDEATPELQTLLLWQDGAIASVLNRQGIRTAHGETWTAERVRGYRQRVGIKAYNAALKTSSGWLTQSEAATRLEISPMSVHRLVSSRILPAEQPQRGLPMVISVANLELPEVQRAVLSLKAGHTRPLPEDPRQLKFF